MDRSGLGRFLRERRESLRPAEVGLAVEGVRRTPGLRREEVAALAGISGVHYGRLERGNAGEPTHELVAILGRVLRLNTDDYSRLRTLAGVPESSGVGDPYVEPGLLYVFDSLSDVPAYILDEVTTIVFRNELAVATFGGREWPMSNMAWGWFVGTEVRAMVDPAKHEMIGQAYVSMLRAAAVWRGDDHPSNRLVAQLAEASGDFAELWSRTTIAPLKPMHVVLAHPTAGPLDINIEMVLSPSTRHWVAMMRPEPGTATRERLATLRAAARPAAE